MSGRFFGLGRFASGTTLGDGADPELRFTFVDCVRVEGFAVATSVPFGHFVVLWMLRIGDGFEKGLKAGNAAAVFGWRAALAFDVSLPLSLAVYAGRRTMPSGRIFANLYRDLAAA